MNDESRPKAASAAVSTRTENVTPPADTLAAPHRQWECDGWAYNAGGTQLGKCVEHLGVPKTSTPEAGVDQALATADPEWLTTATAAVRAAARTGRPFTSDDLRLPPYNVPEPTTAGGWGALLMVMHRRGDIEPCGTTTSTRREAAGRKITLWRGARTEGAV